MHMNRIWDTTVRIAAQRAGAPQRSNQFNVASVATQSTARVGGRPGISQAPRSISTVLKTKYSASSGEHKPDGCTGRRIR